MTKLNDNQTGTILRLLRTTEMSFTSIARRMNCAVSTVQLVSQSHGVRPTREYKSKRHLRLLGMTS